MATNAISSATSQTQLQQPRQTQGAETRETAEEAAKASLPKEAEQPRPVTNTNGQVTGTVITLPPETGHSPSG